MCLKICFRHYLWLAFAILSFINISSTSLSNSANLTQSNTCIFQLNNGMIINLSPLLNSDQPIHGSTSTSLYIYHPCEDVSLNTAKPSECQSYQLCYFTPSKFTDKPVDFNSVLSGQTKGNFTLLAHIDEGVFRENLRKQPEIVYKHHSPINSSVVITSYVRLECNENIETYRLTIDKTSPRQHELTLSTKHACINTEHHLSGGAVFFIILLVFVALYFIGGILVLKFIRGATGVEMIPNHEFWCKVPQMAKEGIAYMTSCGKNAPDSYEEI